MKTGMGCVIPRQTIRRDRLQIEYHVTNCQTFLPWKGIRSNRVTFLQFAFALSYSFFTICVFTAAEMGRKVAWEKWLWHGGERFLVARPPGIRESAHGFSSCRSCNDRRTGKLEPRRRSFGIHLEPRFLFPRLGLASGAWQSQQRRYLGCFQTVTFVRGKVSHNPLVVASLLSPLQ